MRLFAQKSLPVLFAVLGLLVLTADRGYANPDTLTLEFQEIASGFSSPVFLTHAPGDFDRLFIVERGGTIRIIKNGTTLASPFLDISSLVQSGNEQGLLGLAFHPDFPDSSYIYVNYTRPGGDTRVARFTVTANPDVADPGSLSTVLDVVQPFSNHNGGMLAFGPDDYLYLGMGDGGSAGDPEENAQSDTTLLGKMLRIDVNTVPYAVPGSNPYVGDAGILDEIWAFGVRNPWRWAFDRTTGDLWMADVGQGQLEEINYQAVTSTGGENYGWDIMEGTDCYEPSVGCDQTGLVMPLYEYSHSAGRCSITGGYVYRGCAIPDLDGWYFYGDYCTGEVWRIIRLASGLYQGPEPIETISSFQLSSFGEDAYGELYLVELNTGIIRKLVHVGAVEDYCAGPCCVNTVGNVNADAGDEVDISDLTKLVNHLFVDFLPVACPAEANCNGDIAGDIDISDLTALVNHLFITFGALPDCA
jgi:glucose/arabinose dehydrogenase